jgi:AraC-like DNA-binding protein
MLCQPVIVSVVLVQGLLSGIRARKLETPAWIDSALEEANIAPALLNQVGTCVTAEQYATLIRVLIDRRNDEWYGLLSRPLRRGSFTLMARSTLNAPSLEAALQQAADTFTLLQDDIILSCVREGSLIGLRLDFRSSFQSQQMFLHEYLLRQFWQLLAWLHAEPLTARRADFSFEQPAHVGTYPYIFPCPHQFNQPRTALWFDSDMMAGPVRRDEQALRLALPDAVINLIVPRPGDHATSAKVRTLLQQASPAWPDLETMADLIHISTSTLQRRLAAEGTSYQALKDQLRHDIAIRRLSTSDVPIATLAAELGFADSAAFQRAFKSWTGVSAGSYRSRLFRPEKEGEQHD